MQAASSFALGVSLDYLGGQGKTKATGFLRSSEALVLNTAARPQHLEDRYADEAGSLFH